jgi:hypothetical protein
MLSTVKFKKHLKNCNAIASSEFRMELRFIHTGIKEEKISLWTISLETKVLKIQNPAKEHR